jgi:hypothetical protein
MASAKIINENNRRKYHGGVMAWRISNGIKIMAKKWRKINSNESNIGMAAKNNEESSVAKYQYQWRHGHG